MNITVYCGASFGTSSDYSKVAKILGKWIAENSHTLVFGASRAGLMGVVADAVIENRGRVIGVIPDFLMESEPVHPSLSEMIVVDSMSDRKQKMFELGDCFIALPGGIGTLEEISEVTSWAKIGKNNHPCLFVNVNSYYENLKNFYKDMLSNGFIDDRDFNRLIFVNSSSEMIDFLKRL